MAPIKPENPFYTKYERRATRKTAAYNSDELRELKVFKQIAKHLNDKQLGKDLMDTFDHVMKKFNDKKFIKAFVRSGVPKLPNAHVVRTAMARFLKHKRFFSQFSGGYLI